MSTSNLEIERKFLVKGDFSPFVTQSFKIKQGFLSTHSERIVRIRIQENQAFLGIKGKTEGIKRFEWEIEIPVPEAEELLKLCELYPIEKTRHIVPVNEAIYFEIDVFEGVNQGLIVAELELPEENYIFPKPDWLGKEISDDVMYYNSNLSRKPFTQW